MKQQFSLSVASPCTENWSNFQTTPEGGFCQSCQKTVVDFTKMNDQEILRYFSDRQSHTCGRFHPAQLKEYAQVTAPTTHAGWKWLQAGFLTALLMFESGRADAQTVSGKGEVEDVQSKDSKEEKSVANLEGYTAKGTIVDNETKETLAGITVVLKGSTTGVVSDIDGQFVFPKPLMPGDVLVFSFIGYNTQEYIVPKNAASNLEVPLEMNLKFCSMIMGQLSIDHIYATKSNPFRNAWQKVASLF
ncbi:MAG: carboxypeptidase-like regulatory domain-containing protein [Imperialibacter sp.]|uniref:carboxypeptidase-like regulatory domain-containing protein n=1 Tax=Imperialibacter sp. TaxID=2038411 RepID=UPI003A883E6B